MSRRLVQFCGIVVAAGGLAMATALSARAALVDLDLYVSHSVLDNTDNCASPLVDGSWIMTGDRIVGTGVGAMAIAGRKGGRFANTMQNDDLLLNYVYIGEYASADAGKLLQRFARDTTGKDYVYIRYFQTAAAAPSASYWARPTYNFSPTNYVPVSMDIVALTSFGTTDGDITVIPEPATGALLFLAGGLLFSLHMTRSKRAKRSLGRPIGVKRTIPHD